MNINISGSGSVFEGTWANLLAGYPAASHTLREALVVDPTYFINPLRVRSDGTKWRLDGDQTLWLDTTPMTGAAGTDNTEQLQKQWTAPAGFLTSMRWFSIKRLVYKTATSDIYSERIRVGAGATPLTDAQWSGLTAIAGSTNRSSSLETQAFAASSTQITRLGQQNAAGAAWAGSASAGTYPSNVIIFDSDAAATVFSCTMQLSVGTDSSASGQAHLLVSGG